MYMHMSKKSCKSSSGISLVQVFEGLSVLQVRGLKPSRGLQVQDAHGFPTGGSGFNCLCKVHVLVNIHTDNISQTPTALSKVTAAIKNASYYIHKCHCVRGPG